MNAKTDNHNLAGKRNLLTDALHEMGYDDSLVDTLIERDIIDFGSAEHTSHVMDDLIERYGEEVLCGGLPRTVAREDAQVKLAKGENIEKYIQDIITDEIEALGLKAVNGANLEKTRNLPRELGRVKRNCIGGLW